MDILKNDTTSLCDVCLKDVPAKVCEDKGQVKIEKVCPAHGKMSALIEKDVDCYKRFAHLEKDYQDGTWESLVIPVTYKCNTQCSFCYIPDRNKNDITIRKFEKIVSDFKGPIIVLSGGEPTLRKDLTKLIQIVIHHKKFPILQTNGLKLADLDYVRVLKKSGLTRVHFSFDGFNQKLYEELKGSRNHLEVKLQALDNLKQENYFVLLGTTIYKGVNEGEIQKIVQYIIEQGSHIYQLRLRSCIQVGLYKKDISNYCLSEMFGLFAKAIDAPVLDLYQSYLSRHSAHSIHHVDLKVFFQKKGSSLKPLPKLSQRIGTFYFHLDRFLKFFNLYKHMHKMIWLQPKRETFFSRLNIRIISWPSVHNIDLNEVDRGIAHVYDDNIINFCHAVVLNQKL